MTNIEYQWVWELRCNAQRSLPIKGRLLREVNHQDHCWRRTIQYQLNPHYFYLLILLCRVSYKGIDCLRVLLVRVGIVNEDLHYCCLVYGLCGSVDKVYWGCVWLDVWYAYMIPRTCDCKKIMQWQIILYPSFFSYQ